MADTSYITVKEMQEWIDDNPARITDASGNDRDAMLATLALAVSRRVERDTGRIFYKQTSVTRTYYGEVDHTLWVVDLLSTSPTITIDANGDDVPETAFTDYVLLPKTENGIAATRYQKIRPSLGATYTFWPGRPVTITGDWGYVVDANRPPEEIRTACLIMATRWYMRRKAKLGRAVIPEVNISETLAKTDPDYQSLIAPFVHDSLMLQFA